MFFFCPLRMIVVRESSRISLLPHSLVFFVSFVSASTTTTNMLLFPFFLSLPCFIPFLCFLRRHYCSCGEKKEEEESASLLSSLCVIEKLQRPWRLNERLDGRRVLSRCFCVKVRRGSGGQDILYTLFSPSLLYHPLNFVSVFLISWSMDDFVLYDLLPFISRLPVSASGLITILFIRERWNIPQRAVVSQRKDTSLFHFMKKGINPSLRPSFLPLLKILRGK
jgi:hypothetical protein